MRRKPSRFCAEEIQLFFGANSPRTPLSVPHVWAVDAMWSTIMT